MMNFLLKGKSDLYNAILNEKSYIKRIFLNFLRMYLYFYSFIHLYPKKKETHHLELMTSQKDHKRWTSFVYIGSKVCQLLLHCTSFATRGENVSKKNGHKPSGSQIVKSRKKVCFIMLSCWSSSSNWNRLRRSNGT